MSSPQSKKMPAARGKSLAFGGTIDVPLSLVVLLTLLPAGTAIRVAGLPLRASSSPAPFQPRLDGPRPSSSFPCLRAGPRILPGLLRAFPAAL